MAGPWDKYQSSGQNAAIAPSQSAIAAQGDGTSSTGPWAKYQAPTPLTPDQINAHLNEVSSGPDFSNVQSAITSTAPMTRDGPQRTTAEALARSQLFMIRDLA